MTSRSSLSAIPKVQLDVEAGDFAAVLVPCWKFEHVQCLVTVGMLNLTDHSFRNEIHFPFPLRSCVY